MIGWRDHWWYFSYRWHRWRLERAYLATFDHVEIIENHLGVSIEKIRIKKHRSRGALLVPNDDDEEQR